MDKHQGQKAPEDYTDREELRIAIRTTMFQPNSEERMVALRARNNELRVKWCEEHADEIAAQEQRYVEARNKQCHEERVKSRMVQNDVEAMYVLTQMEHNIIWANNREFYARQEADKLRAEAEKQRKRADRAEAGQIPRGVPFNKTSLATKPNRHEFTPNDFCEALKREPEHATAIRRALASWGKGTKRGTHWALTRDEAEAFWVWHNAARHKAHPTRPKNKIARK